MLWKIVDTPHRLLGSIHILPEKAVLPDWVTASYDGIERFVFEADHRSPPNQEVGIDRTGAHLNLPGASEVYQRAKTLLASIGSNDPFDALLPWRAAFYVMHQLLPKVGLSHAHGVENRFRVMADGNGLSVEFLESPTRAFDLIDSSCKQAQGGLAFFERLVTDAESGAGLLELQRIIRAWLTSDLEALTTIHNKQLIQFPFIFDPSITQRNREWVTVAKRLASDRIPTLFIVGSLHTVGSGSFIEQLGHDGIRLTHISTNET
jgi:uncharacterized protein YbaP (TraB family)